MHFTMHLLLQINFIFYYVISPCPSVVNGLLSIYHLRIYLQETGV